MCHEMLRKYKSVAAFSAIGFLLVGCNEPAGSDVSSDKDSEQLVTEWNLSLWGGKRAITAPADDWADAMYERTDGKWKINIHYGGTLSNPENNLDNLSNGLFEAAAVSPFYSPGKLPLVQVMDLPFIMPEEFSDIVKVAMEMFKEEEIVEELDSWGVVPLLPGMTPQYQYMGKSKIESAEDFDGVKIAGMSADIGKVFAKFGAVPTPMPAPELYSSLEYGAIDGVVFPYSYGMGSYNLYEVSDYGVVNVSAGSPVTSFFANKVAWNDLPDEFKEIHQDYIENDYLDNAVYHIEQADQIYVNKFLDNGIELNKLSDEERDKLVSASQEIWEDWREEWSGRGDTSHLLKRISEIKSSL